MNAICLESVLQRESFTGSANDNILPRVAVKTYVCVCFASACLICVRVQMWTHLSTAPNCLGVPVWTAQMTWGICSEHAHVQRGTQFDHCRSIKVSIILCVLSVDSFLPFLLPRQQTGVFYVTLSKILLSSARIGSAMHTPYAHTSTVISRLAPNRTIWFGAVWCDANLCVLKCVPGFIFKSLSQYFTLFALVLVHTKEKLLSHRVSSRFAQCHFEMLYRWEIPDSVTRLNAL